MIPKALLVKRTYKMRNVSFSVVDSLEPKWLTPLIWPADPRGFRGGQVEFGFASCLRAAPGAPIATLDRPASLS